MSMGAKSSTSSSLTACTHSVFMDAHPPVLHKYVGDMEINLSSEQINLSSEQITPRVERAKPSPRSRDASTTSLYRDARPPPANERVGSRTQEYARTPTDPKR